MHNQVMAYYQNGEAKTKTCSRMVLEVYEHNFHPKIITSLTTYHLRYINL